MASKEWDGFDPLVVVRCVKTREGNMMLRFCCPWGCRRDHSHSGCSKGEDPVNGLGHRASHCHQPGAPEGYFLVLERDGVLIAGRRAELDADECVG